MPTLEREFDIQPLLRADMTLFINGQQVAAAEGETVLSVIQAEGQRLVALNDHAQVSGAYCGMGVCHCCLVSIDGRYKRRACQTLAKPGMHVQTLTNRLYALEVL